MTRANPTRLSGLGLHDGLNSCLELSLRTGGDADGVQFHLPAGSFSAVDLARLTRDARRSTILRSPVPEAAVFQTPEHLLAALLFFSGTGLDVRCDSAEVPGLDGSSLPFRDALAGLVPEKAAFPAWSEYPSDLAWEYHWSYGWIRVRPADRFRVRFELDRGPLKQAFAAGDPATVWNQILPARTFAFHREWIRAGAEGLMAGARADSGLLLAETEPEHGGLLRDHPDWSGGPFPLLNQPGWRMESEPVKHKILDLIGDLALLGLALPALDIEILNGGHGVNHLLIDQILSVSPEAGRVQSAK
ncbi:MAG: UDP-3-O-acyl-N-acetylglucosamine deacetylase [Fibrobacteria bacterium]